MNGVLCGITDVRFTGGCSTQLVWIFKSARYFCSSARRSSDIFSQEINQVATNRTGRDGNSRPTRRPLFFVGGSSWQARRCCRHLLDWSEPATWTWTTRLQPTGHTLSRPTKTNFPFWTLNCPIFNEQLNKKERSPRNKSHFQTFNKSPDSHLMVVT